MDDLSHHLSEPALLALVMANVLAAQLGVPVPVTPTLVLAGALAANRTGLMAMMLVGAVAACGVADCVWYWAGHRFGGRVMKLLCMLSLTPDYCVSDTQRRFDRWGGKALLVAKFVPGLGAIASPLAGAHRMPLTRFLYLNGIGSTLWVGLWLSAGVVLNRQIALLLPHAAAYGKTAASIAVLLLVAYIAFKWLQRRRFYARLRMARIEVAELHRLLTSSPAPHVVDVRSRSSHALDPRLIPGAIHVPSEDIAGHVTALSRNLDVILYCTCPNEASAAQVAKVLMNLGFKRVRPLHGGLDAWVEAGYPVDGAALASVVPDSGIPDIALKAVVVTDESSAPSVPNS
jgi:membrane protein DedA with SNARE-associated domain/rhodanese-related sulfurtransferase